MPTYSTQTYNRVTHGIIAPVMPSPLLGGTGFGSPAGSITIYSGEQPTADTVAANWSSYRTTNASCITHIQTGITYGWNPATSTTFFTNVSGSITGTALNTGTATWAILWDTTVTPVQAGLTTLPDERFLVVPVGTTSSNAVIRFTNTNFVPGGAVTPYDGGISYISQLTV
jgi:hypothetical protein